ncbi:hypothetical protein DFQ28_000087 [Apophysomyces sp. BC1034]|nr:hypothetical protein DFQ29_008576 [Apophysomyces sp. BC1021]KAG0194389.1 hypothetical protein DFQ28_000087 [Apophysomyces sp. BC1034]
MMIPGQYLRFFKDKNKDKPKQPENDSSIGFDQIYTKAPRSFSHSEFDSTPTNTQERMAERINRALSMVYSVESLPTHLITPSAMKIHSIKVSRNLRRCQIAYVPLPTKAEQRGKVHRAIQKYADLLSSLIRTHGQIYRPLSIKFVADTQAKELDTLYEKISAELKEES